MNKEGRRSRQVEEEGLERGSKGEEEVEEKWKRTGGKHVQRRGL